MEEKYLDFYIGKLGSLEKDGGVKPKRDPYFPYCASKDYVAFDLEAFSDFSSHPRFGHVHQHYRTKNSEPNSNAKRLFEIVCDPKIPDNATVDDDTITRNYFQQNVESFWFLFYPYVSGGADSQIPEAADEQKDTTCFIEKRLNPPESGNWENAVAVPVFSTLDSAEQDSAKRDWFSTERIQRSKLAIVQPAGGQMSVYFCQDKDAEPQKHPIHNLDFALNTCTFEKIPYVLMRRELYDILCSPNWNTPAERERRFLYHFQKTCGNEEYLFNEKDLRNFHTSVKSGYLTILEGLSGTGKSSIVRLYKDAYGNNCKLCFLPVSPAWTDDTELLGYWDPRKNEYVQTELLDFLMEAQENQHCLYLICLDEMNLARVEHYFYRILSVMEKPLEERVLTLHNAPECKTPQSIKIGNNVRFVGTVNVDDTTFNFADKVRDRANIISLQVANYRDNPFRMSKKQRNNGAPHDTGKQQSAFETFVKAYNGLTDMQEAELRKFLWSLHEILCGENRPFGVSPRTVKAIGTYLANYPKNDGTTLNTDALDFQVNQRILTKLHGSTELLGELVKAPEGEEQKNEEYGRLYEYFRGDYNLPESRKTLRRKQKELNTYGYCP